MNNSEYKPVAQLLRDRIGLDPAALGPRGVESAVNGRMRRLGITAIPAYTALVGSSPEELEALIEAVVIPETWFFRDRKPFVFLAEFIRSEWKSKPGGEILRILSVPCATGEEPYSIAMTCLDCGLDKSRFSVAAMDINAAFLRKARKAVYGQNSFRGTEPGFRDRFFTSAGQNYALKANIRDCVHFFKINILEPAILPGTGHYNIIFCRNLLIYLHDQARARTLAAIDNLLAEGGLLFIGHAETNPNLAEKYEAIKHAGAFAFRKKAKNESEAGSQEQHLHKFPKGRANPPGEPILHRTARSSLRSQRLYFGGAGQGRLALPTSKFLDIKLGPSYKNRAPATTTFAPPPPAKSSAGSLEHATRLADAGRLDEAGEACAAIISADRQNASAHFLMGLIKEARGDNGGAAECFNRAIYLDTDFSDAILHLAVLKEESGDSAGTEALRRRADAINKST